MAALLFTCLICSVTGCGSSLNAPSGDVRAARGVLKVLGMEYGRFVAENNGRPPKDRQELTVYLETRKGRIPGLKEVEQLFVSPRDGEPLLIYYGQAMPPADESGYPIVARETTGEAGSYLVANTRGGVAELAFDQFPPHLGASE